jgi:hypothetical protein
MRRRLNRILCLDQSACKREERKKPREAPHAPIREFREASDAVMRPVRQTEHFDCTFLIRV